MSDDSTETDKENSVWEELEDIDSDERDQPLTEPPTNDSTATTDEFDAVDAEQTPEDAEQRPKDTDTSEQPETPDSEELFENLAADQPAEVADKPDADEIFDEMDVSAVDGEALWDQLSGYESNATGLWETASEPTVDRQEVQETAAATDPSAHDDPAQTEDDETVTVDKRRYCQQCPYFSEPPETSCSHEGTSIVEVLIDGQFRLRDCPVVTDSGPDRTMLNDGH